MVHFLSVRVRHRRKLNTQETHKSFLSFHGLYCLNTFCNSFNFFYANSNCAKVFHEQSRSGGSSGTELSFTSLITAYREVRQIWYSGKTCIFSKNIIFCRPSGDLRSVSGMLFWASGRPWDALGASNNMFFSFFVTCFKSVPAEKGSTDRKSVV